jgi:hypothetical protein
MSRPGAGENDGSDFAYRERVAERYTRLAGLRRHIGTAARAQAAALLARSAWKLCPLLLGAPLASVEVADRVVAGLFPLAAALYLAALGGKRAARLGLVKVYSMACALLAAECVLMLWQYHVIAGAHARDPAARAAYPRLPRAVAPRLGAALGLPAAPLADALALFEKGVELAAIAACAASVFFTRDLVLEERAQAAEAAERRAAGAKAE